MNFPEKNQGKIKTQTILQLTNDKYYLLYVIYFHLIEGPFMSFP